MLKYKEAVIHDGCACCRVPLADVARAIDPTGTRGIRMAMRADITIRFNRIRALLREAIVDQNILGLTRGGAVTSAMIAQAMTAGGAQRLEIFQRWIDTALSLTVLEQNGTYLKNHIQRGYDKGQAFGQAQVKDLQLPAVLNNEANRIDTLAKLTFVELQGVCEAVSQQACRAVANAILTKRNGMQIVRAVYKVLTTIGIARADAIAEFVIVRAFNEATLDVYAQAGVAKVGLVPESKGQTRDQAFQDAPQRQARRSGAGSRTSRTEAPSRRTVQRIRAQEREVERLGRVKVRTAGDDKVCPVCEGIADEGPYSIDRARALIPAHPRCRCTFVPVRDRRFARDENKQGALAL